MAVLKPYEASGGERGLGFTCPGCGYHHSVRTEGKPPSWGWNGSLDKPTFTPSLLIRQGHFVRGLSREDCGFCKREARGGGKSPCGVCHSFVTDGRIQFLGDCTHALAGQTVDLPEIREEGS
jgi:hypothetical protein